MPSLSSMFSTPQPVGDEEAQPSAPHPSSRPPTHRGWRSSVDTIHHDHPSQRTSVATLAALEEENGKDEKKDVPSPVTITREFPNHLGSPTIPHNLANNNEKLISTRASGASNTTIDPTRTFDDRFLVTFEPNDPENPRNWSKAYRWYITFATSFLVLNATFASSAPSGLVREMMMYFGVSREVGTLLISLFVAGYCV